MSAARSILADACLICKYSVRILTLRPRSIWMTEASERSGKTGAILWYLDSLTFNLPFGPFEPAKAALYYPESSPLIA